MDMKNREVGMLEGRRGGEEEMGWVDGGVFFCCFEGCFEGWVVGGVLVGVLVGMYGMR